MIEGARKRVRNRLIGERAIKRERERKRKRVRET